ncbi:hypothetical protein [Bacteroides sp. 51]|uniref:hypothetical protein n=1 Tax=Bacteroides sp. 51 TaxID=2302938 RepID=UPI0013D7CB88|nr:hypothetical protein [Bacteroides sp. 51]NDV82965.1 hypothetical protein [Bacteroides sp. 51]
MEKFSVIWRIKIAHSYYHGGACRYFELKPTPQTAVLLRKRGVLFRKMDVDGWAIIAVEDIRLDEKDVFDFELYCGDQKFHYVTDNATMKAECPQIEMSGTEGITYIFPVEGCPMIKASPGVIARISLKFQAQQIHAERYNELHFQAPERYLEYIFLFRNEQIDKKLLVEDMERKMEFLPEEKIEYMGHQGVRFQSAEKYPLLESPNLKLQLLELFGTNRRVIIRRLSYPEIGMFIDAPPGMLRAVAYV